MRRHASVAQTPQQHEAQRWLASLALLGLTLLLFSASAMARQPEATECMEAGDFIKNAALARDSGMSETDFISRIRDDIELIQRFPPHLRWFVQDDEDAQFLLAAAADVFQKPRRASEHQNDFVKACLRKAGSKPLYSL